MLCRDTLSSVDAIDAELDLPTLSPESLSRPVHSPASLNLSTMPPRLNCVSILVILLVTVLDLLLQLILRRQLANLPTYFGINETQNVKEYGQLGGGWICVYVPEGTSLTSRFRIMMLGSLRILCMSLIRMFWALVPGSRVVRTRRNNRATIIQTGVVDTSRYSDTPAGNKYAHPRAAVSQAQS